MSDPNSLYVGQQLLIPDISIFANRENLQASIVQPKHNLTVNTVTHKVQSGDSLYRIAEKYYGDPANWKKIYKANEEKIEDQGLLRKGQILVIP